MVDRFLLNLDYATEEEAVSVGVGTFKMLDSYFSGDKGVLDRVGIKLNGYFFPADPELQELFDMGVHTVADLKAAHTSPENRRYLDSQLGDFPIDAFTVTTAGLWSESLKDYAKYAHERVWKS